MTRRARPLTEYDRRRLAEITADAERAERDALTRTCLTCGAPPGTRCIQQRGDLAGISRKISHPTRRPK